MTTPDRTSTSPHFNPSPPSGQGVVIHATRSGISNYPLETEATLNWFANPASKVSAHWVIGRDGEKVRVIPDSHQAWHAGTHNATHWGIELCQGDEDDGFTQPQMDSLIEVCRGYVALGVQPIHSYPHGFIGHDESPQGKSAGKSDPGYLFNWSGLIAGLTTPTNKEGWHHEPPYHVLYNMGIPVFRIGGELPGQLSKLFGDHYEWLITDSDGTSTRWSRTPGD